MQNIAEVKAFIDTTDELSGYVRLLLGVPFSAAKDDPHRHADLVVESFGFSAIGHRAWHSLSPVDAKALLAAMLHRGLAYEHEMMPRKTAEHLADVLLQSLDRFNATFMANGSITENQGKQWTPIGTSTFEMAVVGIDGNTAFLLYAEGED